MDYGPGVDAVRRIEGRDGRGLEPEQPDIGGDPNIVIRIDQYIGEVRNNATYLVSSCLPICSRMR